MGVLACDREGCENIMCDRLSDTFGYLCWECFDELVGLGVQTDIAVFLEGGVTADRNQEAARAYFEKMFPSRSELEDE